MSLINDIFTLYYPTGSNRDMYNFIKRFNRGFSIAYEYKKVFDYNNNVNLFRGMNVTNNDMNITAKYDGTNMDVINYNILFNPGYITINEYGNHVYYHLPEPMYYETEPHKEHIDYLNDHDITMYDIANQQLDLYNIARELPSHYNDLLMNNKHIEEINYNPNANVIKVHGTFPEDYVFEGASMKEFRSLVAHLYHGNTLHDVTKITDPLSCYSCYSLIN